MSRQHAKKLLGILSAVPDDAPKRTRARHPGMWFVWLRQAPNGVRLPATRRPFPETALHSLEALLRGIPSNRRVSRVKHSLKGDHRFSDHSVGDPAEVGMPPFAGTPCSAPSEPGSLDYSHRQLMSVAAGITRMAEPSATRPGGPRCARAPTGQQAPEHSLSVGNRRCRCIHPYS